MKYYAAKYSVKSETLTIKGATDFFSSELDKDDPSLKEEAIEFIKSAKGIPGKLIQISSIKILSNRDWETFKALEERFNKDSD